MTPQDMIHIAARQQHYLTPENLELLEIDAAEVRLKRFSTFNWTVSVQSNVEFLGFSRLRFAVADDTGVIFDHMSCEAQFFGRLTETSAAIHSVAVEEFCSQPSCRRALAKSGGQLSRREIMVGAPLDVIIEAPAPLVRAR
ncbi:MAG: hypothetical protein IOB84_02300 [Brevundimonas sp.]|jgi:hypothetical protein|nr:hypothetical protein [Brevundimonas sp.]